MLRKYFENTVIDALKKSEFASAVDFNEIKTELSSIGCTLDFYHYIGQHDRWWINLEDKIALFGASINTIGVSKCTFIELKNDFKEAQDVIDDLIAEGVINGTEWNTGT